VAIKDHGPGMSADDQRRVFERFYRASSNGASGVGLGLSIARRIAELHQGSISVQSQPGEGTTFSVGIKMI
jgi:two-component system OmpR family sensor kinase